MQAHGGSAMALKEGTGDGCVNYDLDGDGDITEGKAAYLWFGEDKTNNTRPVDGVRCYSSTDLYNWTDRGTILYTQSTILPLSLIHIWHRRRVRRDLRHRLHAHRPV